MRRPLVNFLVALVVGVIVGVVADSPALGGIAFFLTFIAVGEL